MDQVRNRQLFYLDLNACSSPALIYVHCQALGVLAVVSELAHLRLSMKGIINMAIGLYRKLLMKFIRLQNGSDRKSINKSWNMFLEIPFFFTHSVLSECSLVKLVCVQIKLAQMRHFSISPCNTV